MELESTLKELLRVETFANEQYRERSYHIDVKYLHIFTNYYFWRPWKWLCVNYLNGNQMMIFLKNDIITLQVKMTVKTHLKYKCRRLVYHLYVSPIISHHNKQLVYLSDIFWIYKYMALDLVFPQIWYRVRDDPCLSLLCLVSSPLDIPNPPASSFFVKNCRGRADGILTNHLGFPCFSSFWTPFWASTTRFFVVGT